MTAHATLGASSSDRWINCPGSIRLSEGQPDTSSPYAREGTAAHELAYRSLTKRLPPDTWLDSELEGVPVTEEMCEAVQVYVDYVQEKGTDRMVFLEQKFDLSELKPPAPMFGTADCAIWDNATKTLEVPDYKHGKGYAVAARRNPQLMYYALGAILKLRVKPVKVVITIVQPRAAHPDGIIRSDELTWDELVTFCKKELLPAARATLAPDAPLKAGGWCQFCKALAVCPEQHRAAVEVAQVEFDTPAPVLPGVDALTPEQMLKVLAVKQQLEDWLGAVYDHVKAKAEAGEPVPGWKLVPKRATRKWTDEEAVLDFLDTETDLRPDVYNPRKLCSPAQVEKAFKEIKAEVPAPLLKLQSKISSGYNLAPDTDARTGVALPPAADEFVATEEAPAPPQAPKKARKPRKKAGTDEPEDELEGL